jgi:AAA15 family ATPase/GTPase
LGSRNLNLIESSMTTQAIQNLEITNFKCFKDLKVSGIGRVNLIGGKNNVGKTAFLEAIELFASSNAPYDLAFIIDAILRRRQNEVDQYELDFFYNQNVIININSKFKSCRINLVSAIKYDPAEKITDYIGDFLDLSVVTNGGEIKASIPITKLTHPNRSLTDSRRFHVDLWRISKGDITYISSARSKERDIAIVLGKLIESDREEFLNKSLSLFDTNIIAVKQVTTEDTVILKLKLKNQPNLVLLSSLGEGINRYLSILCAIWANKDGFLLIDEIENGIHYTNYRKLWEIIFEASVAANCQLFITTHSKECISAFNEVQLENHTCDAQYFEFYKNQKTGLIDASGIDKEQLRYSLTHEGRVRGE